MTKTTDYIIVSSRFNMSKPAHEDLTATVRQKLKEGYEPWADPRWRGFDVSGNGKNRPRLLIAVCAGTHVLCRFVSGFPNFLDPDGNNKPNPLRRGHTCSHLEMAQGIQMDRRRCPCCESGTLGVGQ